MKKSLSITLCIIIICIIGSVLYVKNKTIKSPSTGIANPASENCVKLGGTLEIQKDATGGEFGICKFSNGVFCEEWALLRGECKM